MIATPSKEAPDQGGEGVGRVDHVRGLRHELERMPSLMRERMQKYLDIAKSIEMGK